MKSLKALLSATTLLTSLLAGSAASAHGDAQLDAQASAHDGQVRMAGLYHIELLVDKNGGEGDKSLRVYVTDHAGNAIPTQGARGTATILSGKTKTSVVLSADGTNGLKGTGRYAATPDMKVVVSITLAGQETAQTRFTPLMLAQDGHAGHAH